MQPLPFGRYLLVDEIAQGGMATVYRAVLRGGPGFQKPAALKRVLRSLSDDPEFVARFADEARIASTLAHSNIVQVFDFGKVDGEYFLAMELVEGPDLGTLMEAARRSSQPIPIPAALFICAALARGLGAAHRRTDEWAQPAPVVHRDVSPQNVLLSRTGEVKVADFGIAKAADKVMRTRTGMVLGKCRYMAPEQAAGELVSPRTDVFATGCVLFELLTDRPVFDGSGPEAILRAVVSQPIPTASALNPEIPPEVDEILGRALSRVVAGRYPDGDALARDVERLLHTMAPEYSRDDLAALVRTLVPPRVERRPTGEHETRTAPPRPPQAGDGPSLDALRDRLALAPTLPEPLVTASAAPVGPPLVATGSVATEAPTQPRPGSPAPSSPTDAALLPYATTHLFDRASEVSSPSVGSLRTGPARREAGVTERSRGRRPRALVRVTLLAVAAAAGLLAGVVLRRSLASRAVGDDGRWSQGAMIQLGPWRLRLRKAQRGRVDAGSQVWVELDIAHARGGAGEVGQYFALVAGDGRVVGPRAYRIPSGPGEPWLLEFVGSGAGPVELRFSPPDADALRRRLPL